MNFKDKYPDFAAIEHHIRDARLERALALSQVIVGGIETVLAGLKRLRGMAARNGEAERDRHAVQADAFLKRSVPRY